MRRNIIRDCRALFEAAGSPSLSESAYRKLVPPKWMKQEDPLRTIIAEQEHLFSGSTVVWGSIAGANDLLFDPGPEDSPASVVYCTATDFDESPAVLRETVDTIRQLTPESDDPQVRAFAEYVADDNARALKVSVPFSIGANERMFHATFVVVRKHLPDGVLSQNLVPLLVNPARTACVTILPSRYWSPEMLDYWTDY
ncbi:MAG: hypothetical protein IPF53_08010 [Blastocatellia bacterium]|nr:hypothetical protein [Blastocatellia bacterium]